MDLPIVLHNRKTRSRQHMQIRVNPGDTIGHIKEKLANRSHLDLRNISLIFCGKALEDGTQLDDLLLGPSTIITALVAENSIHDNGDSSLLPSPESLVQSTPQIGSFYVWCKECADISRAKLRVYCSECKASSAVVQSDPTSWNDVLKSRRIRLDCAECVSPESFAVFSFKCVKCNEVSAALSQVRGNWEQSECCICGESDNFMFDLGCNHPSCRSCFELYLMTSLEGARFSFHPQFGYTIACPAMECDRLVTDVHHFRVMGDEKYRQYQQQATEKLIALDVEGVFCPRADCSASFFLETDEDDGGKTLCPICNRLFCRNCKSGECICNQEDANTVTIEATTRKCPNCGVPTERNGGCAHMHCTSCNTHWCFRCVKPWSEQCQWDHWFG